MSCEIDLLSVEHNLALEQPADRIHRNMDKVRRVASQRIGNERLEAYRARVKEAFEAYFRGSVWPTWDEAVSVNSLEEGAYEDKVDQEERGRGMETKEVRGEFRLVGRRVCADARDSRGSFSEPGFEAGREDGHLGR